MYFYISSWKCEPSGKPFLDDTIKTTIPVNPRDRSTTARRTLGPIKCPGRNQSARYDALLQTSDEFAQIIQSSAMSEREAWTAYFSFYLPKMCYVLNTLFLTEAQLTEIQKKATTARFRKYGSNKNTSTAFKFGPPRLGGIGFRGL
jgi:dsDNA-binding SOS-regulon protein